MHNTKTSKSISCRNLKPLFTSILNVHLLINNYRKIPFLGWISLMLGKILTCELILTVSLQNTLNSKLDIKQKDRYCRKYEIRYNYCNTSYIEKIKGNIMINIKKTHKSDKNNKHKGNMNYLRCFPVIQNLISNCNTN